MENQSEHISAELQKQIQRFNSTFEERNKEYKKLEEELQKRKATLDILSENLIRQKMELEQQEEDVVNREIILKQQEENFRDTQEKWQKSNSELEERKASLVIEQTLLVEELRTKKMKLQREQEELQGEKESGLVVSDIDLAMYIPKEEVAQNYVEKEKYHSMVKELEKQRDVAKQEKTNLLTKVLQMQGHVEEIELETQETEFEQQEKKLEQQETDLKQEEIEDIESAKSKKSEMIEKAESPQKRKEEFVKTEAQEDLTAHVLKAHLDKQSYGFHDVELLHSETGEQILAKKNTLMCRFIFDEPAFFDIVVSRTNDARLQKTLKELNESEQYQGIEFYYNKEDKSVYATGYFTSDIPSYELMKEVERIMECFNE
jgi:Chromosome segregation ATPases